MKEILKAAIKEWFPKALVEIKEDVTDDNGMRIYVGISERMSYVLTCCTMVSGKPESGIMLHVNCRRDGLNQEILVGEVPNSNDYVPENEKGDIDWHFIQKTLLYWSKR